MRVCSKCGESKESSEFYKQASCKDGLRPDCKTCFRSRVKDYQDANLDLIHEKKRQYYLRNADHVKRKATAWQESNREKSQAKQRAYYSRNRAAYRERRAKRRVSTELATPAWSNVEMVRSFYKAVAILNSHDGPAKFSVDHIVPLKSKLVSGLHAHTNLTIVPLPENKAKNNRHWPDMP